MDSGRGPPNGKVPTQAGDIPEKFVVVLEKAKLAIGGVSESVNMAAGRNQDICIAEVNAFSVGVIRNAERLIDRIAGG